MGHVSRIDSCGRTLLRRWHNAGVRFFGKSPLVQTLIGAIVGKSPLRAQSEMKESASNAWEQALDVATRRMDQRVTLGEPFLWADEAPDRLAALRSGETLTSHLSSGRVHDWIAAVFLEGLSLTDVLCVHGRRRSNQEPESCMVQIDGRHAYIVSRTARMQRIGEDQHVIRHLYTITRMAERDTGVYVEMEAIGLSAGLPGPLRWLIEWMARFRPLLSLESSLRDMRRAVHSELTAEVRP